MATCVPTLRMQGYTSRGPYRVVTRKKAIALLGLVISVGALGVRLGLLWVETYSNQMSELIDNSPEQARIKLISDFRLIAMATGALTCALAFSLFRYGLKSLRTQSMPPRNSWVIEGQRIRTGPEAVLFAKLLLVASAIVLVLGIVAAAILWHAPGALLGPG